MLMRNDISPASGHVSVMKSPVPYLLGGVGAMLLLIAFALIILACSYLKDCATEGQEHNRSSEHHNVELVRGGKNEMGVDMSNDSEDREDMRVIVIMAGDEKPTFIAKPTSMRFGEEYYLGDEDAKQIELLEGRDGITSGFLSDI